MQNNGYNNYTNYNNYNSHNNYRNNITYKKKSKNSSTNLFLIVIIVIIAIFIFANNQGNVITDIEWGYMPSPEYYELRLAATTSEVLGNGKGKLSRASFDTLGRDVKRANGIWFKNSNVNFRTKILDDDTGEMVTLTDGEHVAVFIFDNGDDFVKYTFADKEFLETLGMTKYNLLGGYKITIN